MLTALQFHLLKRISPGEPNVCDGSAYANKSKLKVLLGENLLNRIRGKTVIDFGCGEGEESLEMARAGAAAVIGLDIRADALERARARAQSAGLSGVCRFVSSTSEKADVIVSLDSFEHFENPAGILGSMAALLRPQGEIMISFGPPWRHPHGGHLFSVFPWAHLVFSEKALIRWRATFKTDGATRFSEVTGGLTRMTIREFKNVVAASPLRVANLELVPIRRLRLLHNRVTREMTTATVRCRLVQRA